VYLHGSPLVGWRFRSRTMASAVGQDALKLEVHQKRRTVCFRDRCPIVFVISHCGHLKAVGRWRKEAVVVETGSEIKGGAQAGWRSIANCRLQRYSKACRSGRKPHVNTHCRPPLFRAHVERDPHHEPPPKQKDKAFAFTSTT